MIIHISLKDWKENYKFKQDNLILIFYDNKDRNSWRFMHFIENLSTYYSDIIFLALDHVIFWKMALKLRIKKFPVTIFRWDGFNKIRINGNNQELVRSRVFSFNKKIFKLRNKEMEILSTK